MPGFDFSNHNRNAVLYAKGAPLPKATSTGTTIVGCVYDKGVVVSLPGQHKLLLYVTSWYLKTNSIHRSRQIPEQLVVT